MRLYSQLALFTLICGSLFAAALLIATFAATGKALFNFFTGKGLYP